MALIDRSYRLHAVSIVTMALS